MNDNVANLILVQLREMRGEIADMRGEIGSIRADMASLRGEVSDGLAEVNGRIDGLTMMIRLLATHTHHLEARVEKLETRP